MASSASKDRAFLPQRNRWVHGLATLVTASAGAQAINLLSAPLLTRLYAPGEFAVLGLLVTYLGFAAVFSSAGLDSAVIPAETNTESDQLATLGIWLAVGTSFLAAAVLEALRQSGFLGYNLVPAWGSLLVIPALSATGATAILRYREIRRRDFRAVGRVGVRQAAVRAGAQVAAGFISVGAWGLLLGDMFGRLTGVGTVWRGSQHPFESSWRNLPENALRALLSKYSHFVRFGLPSTVLNGLALALPLPLITVTYGPVVGGSYALVDRVMVLPVALIGNNVADAFSGRIARIARRKPLLVPIAYRATILRLLLLGTGPFLAAALLAPVAFPIVFGENWRVAGRLVTSLSPWFLARFAVGPGLRVALITAGQRKKVIWDVLSVALPVVVLTLAGSRGLPLESAMTILGIAGAGLYLTAFLLLDHHIRRWARNQSLALTNRAGG